MLILFPAFSIGSYLERRFSKSLNISSESLGVWSSPASMLSISMLRSLCRRSRVTDLLACCFALITAKTSWSVPLLILSIVGSLCAACALAFAFVAVLSFDVATVFFASARSEIFLAFATVFLFVLDTGPRKGPGLVALIILSELFVRMFAPGLFDLTPPVFLSTGVPVRFASGVSVALDLSVCGFLLDRRLDDDSDDMLLPGKRRFVVGLSDATDALSFSVSAFGAAG